VGVGGAVSKRSRYENANMRGGLGVRKRLSEESMRPTYRLNGVRTGFAVARCYDKYGRWEGGFTVGIIVRKTASVVQIRWADTPEKIHNYDSGDARYEVDRGRWKILGAMQQSPLGPSDPIADALTKLRENARMGASAYAGSPTTEENETEEQGDEMAREMSNAAAERAAARQALKNGDVKERDSYTAKQIATRCGTDAKTMRKFFRSSHSTVEPVGQGGRYEFDSADLPKIKREFAAWRKKAKARSTHNGTPQKIKAQPHAEIPLPAETEEEFDPADFTDNSPEHLAEIEQEPTEEDLAELEDLDLDDLDAEED
jgi:hypothetical protein